MNKQLQQTTKTKENLKESFLSLYAKKDIDKIAIKEITDGAKVYRSTFYIHFKDIYDLLEAIEKEEVISFEEYVKQNFKTATVNAFMELIIQYFNLKGERLYLLVHKSKNNQFSQRLNYSIIHIIQELAGIDQPSTELYFSLEYIGESFIFLLRFWHEHQEEITMSELFPLARKILHQGVIPELKPFMTKNVGFTQKLEQ